MIRRLWLCALAAALSVESGMAAPIFTWAFSPTTYTVGQSGGESFTATIDNTGTTDITGLSGEAAVPGNIGPYATYAQFGTTGLASFQNQFAGIDIAPGQKFSFIFATIDFANAPIGSYTGLAPGVILSLSDSSGGSGPIPSDSIPMLDVTAPEPSSLGLILAGVVCCIGGGLRARHKQKATDNV